MRIHALILAAGQGRRMGQDKALLELVDGQPLVSRILQNCRRGGITELLVVRHAGAQVLPEGIASIEVSGEEDMLASIRAGIRALKDRCDAVLIFPVDFGMVGAAAIYAVAAGLMTWFQGVVLPVYRERRGHPIGLSASLFDQVLAETGTLRDVVWHQGVHRLAVPVDDPWVCRDLDTPADLAAARAALRDGGQPLSLQMRAHRSRRAFHPDPIPAAQLEWLVDSARYASTSSFIQAYAAVAVQEPERKARVAALCADQRHIHEAPVFLAICADLHKLARCCEQQGKDLRTEPLEAFVEALVDASLFGQNLLLAAEAEGLGGCMIGAARQRPVELAQLLELPPHCFVAFGLVLGRPADDPPPRGRMPLPAILHHETYDPAAVDPALVEADAQMRSWNAAINAAGGYNGRPVNPDKGWTERMAAKWSRDFGLREQLAEQLRTLGFGLT